MEWKYTNDEIVLQYNFMEYSVRACKFAYKIYVEYFEIYAKNFPHFYVIWRMCYFAEKVFLLETKIFSINFSYFTWKSPKCAKT